MSRVFVARDEVLGRRVVVKVLPPDLAAGLSAERFTREIRLAASLQQANIVPLLSVGQSYGLPYYTMPYVDGESLRARLTRGALRRSEAVAVLRDVARALMYAHENGIVHRDIKPENVLLSGATAVVTDFGIAKALTAAQTDHAPGGTLTVAGTSLGSPAYMSPEQAAGDTADQRADLYAWGVIAYELLSGAHPFAGKLTAQQLIAAHIAERPAPLSNTRPNLRRSLAALVMRCLEKDPAARPNSASELLELLDDVDTSEAPVGEALAASALVDERAVVRHRRSLLIIGAVAATIIIVVTVFARSGFVSNVWRSDANDEVLRTGDKPAAVRLAVLPFENLGSPEDAYFADGMADEVRGKLAALKGLLVIARSSSAQYRGSHEPVSAITRDLGVQYLLTGTVRWLKDSARASRVQVRPELVQLSNGQPVTRWQQAFDAVVTDVFGVQAQIAERVAQALDVELGANDRSRLAQPPTRVLAAYDAFLRGEEMWATTLTPAHALPALREFQRAVALDSTFLLALVRTVQVQSVLLGNTPAEARRAGITAEEVRRGADRAVQLSGSRPDGHVALGYYYGLVNGDNQRAREEFIAGLADAPNDEDLLVSVAYAEMALGRWEAALAHAQRANLIDPRSNQASSQLGNILLSLRRYADAEEVFTRAREFHPDDGAYLSYLVMAALGKGDVAKARAQFKNAVTKRDSTSLGVMAMSENFVWLLDDPLRAVLERLEPEAFGGDRVTRMLALSELGRLRADATRSRLYADSARLAAEEALQAAPDDRAMHAQLALALAYRGSFADAVREGKRAVEHAPASMDVSSLLDMQQTLARIYVLSGDHEKAIDLLELLLREPFYLSPAWVRLDPAFAPLRGKPRFERLVAGH